MENQLLSGLSETVKSRRPSSKSKVPPLKTLLKDPDVANFYRLIKENDFRLQAIDLLNARLAKM